MNMLVEKFKSKPITVEASYYNGSADSAADFCAKWPDDFMIGEADDGELKGLYIVIRNQNSGKLGVLMVAPGDMVFREDDGQFCSMGEEAFLKYFEPTGGMA